MQFSIEISPLVSIQCVHDHRKNKKRKAAVIFKMVHVAVEIIGTESEMGFCTESHIMIT